MRKNIYRIGMLAVAALAFFSCQKEQEPEIEKARRFVEVTFSKDDQTRTAVSEGQSSASYIWTQGDENYLHVYENGVEGSVEGISYSQDMSEATLTVSFDPSSATSFEYTATYGSNLSNKGNPLIPAEQHPATTSFDPAADVMISKVVTSPTALSSISFTMGRVVTVNKMTLTGLDVSEKVSKVEFELSAYMSSRYMIGDKSFTGNSNKLTFKYTEAAVSADGTFPVYFVSAPVDAAGIVGVVVTTDKNVYTKTSSLNPNPFNGKTITFAIGTMKRFTMAMSGYGEPIGTAVNYTLVECADDIAAGGEYIFVSTKKDDAGLCAASSYATGSNHYYTSTDVTANNKIIAIDAQPAMVFTLEAGATPGQYYIKDSDGMYLSWSTGNGNTVYRGDKGDTDAYLWTISLSDGIANVGTADRIMQYNSASPRFACYTSTQTSISLYVNDNTIIPDPRTAVTLSFSPANPADLTLGDTFTEPTLTVDPSEAPVAYSVETVPANIATINASTGKLTITAAGTITVTATVSDVVNYKPASESYSLTVVDPNVVDYVTLPWAYPEGDASATSSGIQAITGVTAVGLGSDYAAGNAPYQIKLDGDGDYFQIKTDGAIGQVSVKYKMIGGSSSSSLTFSESSDGNTFTEVQSLYISGDQNSTGVLTTTNAFASGSRYVKIVFTKGSNVGIGGISITQAGPAVTWNLESIAVSTAPTKTTYTAGEVFDPAGMVVTGHFVDADDNTNTKNEEVTGYTITPDGALAVSDTQVTISYQGKTATQNITVNAAPAGNDGSLEHPYTVAEALAIINGYSNKQKSASEVYVSGIIANVGSYNSTYHSVTYDISDDGQNANTLEIYSGKFVANTNFSSNDQISVDDQVIVYGYLYLYGSTKEMYQDSYIYSLNGITKALTLAAPTVTTNASAKQITVAWTAATGTESTVSYVINCGTQSYNATAAGSHTFTMADYGTYNVSVEATASDAVSATVATTAILVNPSSTVPSPETITFSTLGLTNDTQYSDPFDGGNFTITFGGGSNDGKYYTTGSGIRTYGDGTITIASTYKIKEIAFTWSGSNAPTSDVASPSGYSTSTKKWTGSAKSIVLTRPSGSGHWRLQSVTVTYDE